MAVHVIIFLGCFISYFLYLFLGITSCLGNRYDIDRECKRARIRPKKRELHELLYTQTVKSGTIRLDSGFVPTGNRGGECDGSAPSLPAEPVQQTLRPRHERQRQRHQDQVRQSLLLPRVHH